MLLAVFLPYRLLTHTDAHMSYRVGRDRSFVYACVCACAHVCSLALCVRSVPAAATLVPGRSSKAVASSVVRSAIRASGIFVLDSKCVRAIVPSVCMGTIELERCVCLCVPVCEPNISQQRVPPLRHIYYFKTIRWAGFCSRASVRDPRAKCCVCVCVDAVEHDTSTHNHLISYAGSVQLEYYCLQICVRINGAHVSHGFERELKHLRSSASSIMDYRRRRMDAVPALLLPLLLLQLLFMIGGTDAYFDESEMRGK